MKNTLKSLNNPRMNPYPVTCYSSCSTRTVRKLSYCFLSRHITYCTHCAARDHRGFKNGLVVLIFKSIHSWATLDLRTENSRVENKFTSHPERPLICLMRVRLSWPVSIALRGRCCAPFLSLVGWWLIDSFIHSNEKHSRLLSLD